MLTVKMGALPAIVGLSCLVLSCAPRALSLSAYRAVAEGPAAYRFVHPQAGALRAMVPDAGSWSEAEVDRVLAAFKALPRAEVSRSDLLELKFGLQQWRLRGRDRFLGQLLASSKAEDFQRALEGLLRLSPVLTPDDLIAVGRKAASFSERRDVLRTQFARLLSRQGDFRLTRTVREGLPSDFQPVLPAFADGPELNPDITASRESEWPWTRILDTPELSHYLRDAEGRVEYRGLRFVPGDILLVNLANPSEGLFTAFTREENYSYHLALYLEIEKDGRRIPCIYESYEHGTRIVPLVTYLNPAHTLYLEISRWRKPPPDAAARLNAAVLAALAQLHGFNIFIDHSRSKNGHYITCTTTVTQILAQAGFPLPIRRSGISPAVIHNLHRLGIVASEFLTPTDFMAMPELEIVGWNDNQRWQRSLAAALANRTLSDLLESQILDPAADGLFHLYHLGSRAILGDVFILGGLLRWAFGFNAENFPNGPAFGLAFILRVEEELDAAVERIEEAIGQSDSFYRQAPWFSLHAAFADPQLADLVATAFSVTRDWFRSPGRDLAQQRWAPSWP